VLARQILRHICRSARRAVVICLSCHRGERQTRCQNQFYLHGCLHIAMYWVCEMKSSWLLTVFTIIYGNYRKRHGFCNVFLHFCNFHIFLFTALV